MKKNVGSTDRLIRIILGIVLIGAAIVLKNWIPAVLGVVSIGTGVLNFCGLYTLFGINTCKVKQK